MNFRGNAGRLVTQGRGVKVPRRFLARGASGYPPPADVVHALNVDLLVWYTDKGQHIYPAVCLGGYVTVAWVRVGTQRIASFGDF